MKNLILLIFILNNCILNAQNNSGRIIYKVYSSYEGENKDAEVNDFMNKTASELKKLEFELVFQSGKSLFKEKEALEVDNNSYFKNMALAMAGASNRLWYTNHEKMLMQYNFMNELFLIESTKNSIKWELSKETKRIGEYICYKANCTLQNIGSKGLAEKKVEVWFTKEIPIPLGPVGLIGLPGLILEANFFKVKYVASNVNFNTKEKVEIKEPKKGIYLKDIDFYEMASQKAKEYREDIKKQQ